MRFIVGENGFCKTVDPLIATEAQPDIFWPVIPGLLPPSLSGAWKSLASHKHTELGSQVRAFTIGHGR